jgi:4-carboxymuconolactone decarboxylase
VIDSGNAENAKDQPSVRLPLLHPALLDEEQREVYEAITGGPRAADPPSSLRRTDDEGRLYGPFNAMLYSPAVGLALQELGAALRFRGRFTSRQREIATLVVAAHQRSDYEWHAHESLARRAGLTDEELAALRAGRDAVFADVRERIVYEVARELVSDGDISDPLYVEAVATLGRASVVELVTLVGYYAALALHMRVFRVGLPGGEPAPRWPDGPRPTEPKDT